MRTEVGGRLDQDLSKRMMSQVCGKRAFWHETPISRQDVPTQKLGIYLGF